MSSTDALQTEHAQTDSPDAPQQDESQTPPPPPLLTLSAELLDQVFSLLAARKDVGACRLVCKAFHVSSSQFLITRVVYANRVTTINQLYDVLEHPYFRKQTTELVYDASEYRRSYTEGVRDYERALSRSERPVGHDVVKSSDAPYPKLLRRIERHAETESAHHRIAFSQQGYLEYCRLVSDQEDIKASHTDRLVLQQALKAFPRLKSLVFADYRSIAFEDEDHWTCYARLFGHVLEPEPLGVRPFEWRPLCELLDILHHTQSQICDIVVGGNRWALPVGDYNSECGWLFEESPAITLRRSTGYGRSPLDEYPCLNRCRMLCLPVAIGQEELCPSTLNQAFDCSLLPSMLASAAGSLKILELGAVDLMPAREWKDERGHCNGVERFENALSPVAPDILTRLLFPIQFPCLERVALQGWTIRTLELLDFLLHMREHLKELRLEYNILFGDFEQLARSSGAQLSLTGVVLRNYEFQDEEVVDEEFATYELADERDLRREGLWLNGRTNAIPAGSIS